MKKAIVTLLVLGATGAGGYAYYHYKETEPKFTVNTAQVSRGDVVDTVGATGTLQAVTTVQVGTQVSGTISELHADFNSLVKKGQVLARLDPSLFQTQIEQARANLARSQADLERLKVSLEDANTKLSRARELSQRQLLPRSELDAAEVATRAAEAQLKSSEAQVTQAQASLNQNQVNLEHTIIEAPIDGLVISRNVDVGQTVAASMQAPTLFVLAADLTKMQVVANLDESDVGRIRPGQVVTFRVDAYANDTFRGLVSQVRLNPIVQQNVVTYATVIDVPNNELKLKPGMTANVNVEIARSSNVLRVPNSALRFRPTNEMFAALGQTPPDPGQLRDGGGRRGQGNQNQQAAAAPPPAQNQPAPATASASPAAQGDKKPQPDRSAAANPDGPTTGRAGASASADTAAAPRGEGGWNGGRGGGGSGGGGRGGSGGGGRGGDNSGGGDRFAARMQNLTPEEREQRLQRMRERGFDPTAGNTGGPRGGRGGNPNAASTGAPQRGRGAAPADAAKTTAAGRQAGATTIDALFGPLPRVESTGRAWLYVDKQLKPVRLRLGIADGQNTELIEGDLQQGNEVVTNIALGNETRPAATNFPFGQPGRGGFPGGGGFGGPGGGGNRGGGGGGGRGR
jgi:HlyD family secretion protein